MEGKEMIVGVNFDQYIQVVEDLELTNQRTRID